METLLAAAVLLAMDGLAHLRLRPAEFFLCWAPWLIWAVARTVGARWWSARPVWLAAAVGWVATGAGLALVNLALRNPWAGGVVIYAATLIAALGMLLGRWLDRERRAGGQPTAEAWRVLVVGGSALWVMLPFFSDRWIGGVDARWYAYMLKDYLDQLRAGVFPVLIGQGEFAYNGGVHPFRSAPVYMWCAGLWDLLTLRTLPVMALQHLTVITAALVGAYGMYGVVGALTKGRRWLAMGIAVVYVTSPAFLGPIYFADQYMTYLTLGALPVLLYGNVQLAETGARAGWLWLAAGLAAVWFCHPPVAILGSLLTLFVQGGRLLLSDPATLDWKPSLLAAGAFGLLAGHYFYAMSEVPSPLQPSVGLMVAQLAGGVAAVVGMVRGIIWRQKWAWGWLIAGLASLGWTQPAWLWPSLIATALIALLSGLARKRGWFEPGAHAWNLLMGGLLAGVVLTHFFGRVTYPGYSVDTLAHLQRNAQAWLTFLRPLTMTTDQSAAVQPGWAVVFLVVVLAWRVFRGAALLPKLIFAGLFLVAASAFKIPGVSEFWLATLPRALTEMAGLPLVNRLVPPFAAFACVGGALALADLAERRPGQYRGALIVLLVLAAIGVGQAWPYLRRGWAITHTRQDTANQFRTENAVLDRFAYDLMMMPGYVSNGKTDPRLENRLWVRNREVRIGPDEMAKRMEAAGVREEMITTAVEPTAPAWLNLSPKLTLAPGEHLLLRFEFLAKAYDGVLIFAGPHTYREYRLPDSGWIDAFGVKSRWRSKTISLWNSGAVSEDVKMTFLRPTAGGEFGDFARLFISRYDPALAPVRVRSFQPYRVDVTMPTAGWLETPRAYLPGYRATVNGQAVEASQSARWLMRVPLPAGQHEVALDYVGTRLFWVTWWLSAAGWVAAVFWLTRRRA